MGCSRPAISNEGEHIGRCSLRGEEFPSCSKQAGVLKGSAVYVPSHMLLSIALRILIMMIRYSLQWQSCYCISYASPGLLVC